MGVRLKGGGGLQCLNNNKKYIWKFKLLIKVNLSEREIAQNSFESIFILACRIYIRNCTDVGSDLYQYKPAQ